MVFSGPVDALEVNPTWRLRWTVSLAMPPIDSFSLQGAALAVASEDGQHGLILLHWTLQKTYKLLENYVKY